ncbi:MAG: sulfatase-like hydrolase/transferase, partial [Bacteroidota bacterium]
MNIYVKFITLYCLLCLLSCAAKQQKKTTKSPPNILLILTDDQGWGDLSINGNTNLRTPNIDQLAGNGVTLDRFYVSPVCSPTRAEILTGRYAVRSGVYSTSQGGERIDLDETTLADIFQRAGYTTGALGKWHSGMQYPYHPNGRGFEEFYGFCSGHWGNYIDPVLEHNGNLVKGEGFLPDDLTNKTIHFIEKNKDRPFFAYLPLNTPHSPMHMPDKWWERFKDKELNMLGDGRQKEEIGHTKAALAFVENIDYNVGRIVQKLQALDLEENT